MFSTGSIVVCYGKAVSADQVKEMNERELVKNLTDTLRRMQTESREKQGKKPYNYQ
jgi:hypothetical protein